MILVVLLALIGSLAFAEAVVIHHARVVAAKPMRVVSRSDGGDVGLNELTLVGEHGPEFAALPAGSPSDLPVLTSGLAAGSVLVIVGAKGPEHVELPPGSTVYTAMQTVNMLRGSTEDEQSDQ